MDEIVGLEFLEPAVPRFPGGIALMFETEESAARCFALLREWSQGADDDSENNVRLSLIREDDGRYVLCLYPNHGLEPGATLGRRLDATSSAEVDKFLAWSERERSFLLIAELCDAKGRYIRTLPEIRPLLKRDFRVAARAELRPDEVEHAIVMRCAEARREDPRA